MGKYNGSVDSDTAPENDNLNQNQSQQLQTQTQTNKTKSTTTKTTVKTYHFDHRELPSHHQHMTIGSAMTRNFRANLNAFQGMD